MLQATNAPYRKQYDEKGLPVNTGTILNDGTNRQGRRSVMQKKRAFNNSRNIQQVVTPRHRWLKVKQHETDENGRLKVIHHLIYKR